MEAVIEDDKVVAHDPPINMLPRLTRESVDYIGSRKGKKEPFFLYVPLGSPHTPILPSPEWEGKSGLGKYGDFVMQTENVVGEIQAGCLLFDEKSTCVYQHMFTDTKSSEHWPIDEMIAKMSTM